MADREDIFKSLEGEPSREELVDSIKLLTNTIVIERHATDAVYAAMLAQAQPEELPTIEKFYHSILAHKQAHLMSMVWNAMQGNFDLDLDG